MSEPKKKRRRPRGGWGRGGETVAGMTSGTSSQATIQGLPAWRWRTFPVYFAMTGGLFAGIYIGIAVGLISANYGNDVPMTVALVVAALAFGFALSRMTSRFMVTRRWVKPKRVPPS